jgi:hypothetical protein
MARMTEEEAFALDADSVNIIKAWRLCVIP